MAAKELYTTTLFNDPTLKLYYRFSETSGTTVNDSSTGGHNGTASRTNILNNSGGVFGNKGVFERASTDRVTITDHADLKPTSGGFTVGGWIKRAAASGVEEMIFTSWNGLSSVYAGILLSINPNGTIRIASCKNTGLTQGTDWQAASSATAITDTTTFHLVIGVWDGSQLKVYIDGSPDGTPVNWANAPAYKATNYVRLGDFVNQTGSEADSFGGSVDDFFLFNGKALSPTEISNYYNGLLASRFGGSFLLNFI